MCKKLYSASPQKRNLLWALILLTISMATPQDATAAVKGNTQLQHYLSIGIQSLVVLVASVELVMAISILKKWSTGDHRAMKMLFGWFLRCFSLAIVVILWCDIID